MTIRSRLASIVAAIALALGGLSIGTPAHAAGYSFNKLFTSKELCLHKTNQKVSEIRAQNVKSIKVRYICKSGQGLYGTSISWQTR